MSNLEKIKQEIKLQCDRYIADIKNAKNAGSVYYLSSKDVEDYFFSHYDEVDSAVERGEIEAGSEDFLKLRDFQWEAIDLAQDILERVQGGLK